MPTASYEVVRDTISRIRDIEPAMVSPQAQLAADLGVDSLYAIEIIFALEEHYGREFDGGTLDELKTVADVVALVDSIVGS